MIKFFQTIDHWLVQEMERWGIPLLRITLGIVFVWFGLLKMLDASPVVDMIRDVYPFFPTIEFMAVLGVWEVIIGLGLLTKRAPRITIALLWLQMAGVFASPLLRSDLFYTTNPFFLTTYGEFVIKNIVFLSASLVIGSHIVREKELRVNE